MAFARPYAARRHAPLMIGRPAVSAPAPGAAPQLELKLDDQAALQRVRAAGAAGLPIGPELAVSTAIRLGLLGLVSIDKAAPQRVRLKRLPSEGARARATTAAQPTRWLP